MKKQLSLRVTLKVPAGLTTREMVDYVRYAVSTLRGSYSPDDPIFDLDPDSVRVVPIARKRKATSK